MKNRGKVCSSKCMDTLGRTYVGQKDLKEQKQQIPCFLGERHFKLENRNAKLHD